MGTVYVADDERSVEEGSEGGFRVHRFGSLSWESNNPKS